jgi:hypothetical protein
MENSHTALIIFSLICLSIVLGVTTYFQFEKMRKHKFKGEEKSEGKTSIVIAIGEAITEE